MQTFEPNKVALTIRQFCQTYSVGRSLAYSEMSTGKLRFKKAGRRTLILRADADLWLDQLPVGGSAHDAK